MNTVLEQRGQLLAVKDISAILSDEGMDMDT